MRVSAGSSDVCSSDLELDDWTRAGRGRLLGEREEVELALLLDYALVGSGIRDARVDDDGNVALVAGDPQRLTQLLRTLLDFALSRGGLSGVSYIGRASCREGVVRYV